MGKCYIVSASKILSNNNEAKRSAKISINLPRNDSEFKLYAYILPSDADNAVILDNWHYPVKTFEIQNLMYIRLTITKEFQLRKSRANSPCTSLPEERFYKVPF